MTMLDRAVTIDRPGPPTFLTAARWAALRARALSHPLTNLRTHRQPEAVSARLPGGWTVIVSVNN